MTRRYPPKVEAREKLAERLAFERPWEKETEKPYDVGGLNERRCGIVDDLEEAARDMRLRWAGKSIDQLGEQFKSDKAEFDKAVDQAIRAGVDHPLVREWIANTRSVGDKEKLRVFRRGLETDLRQERKKGTIWILDELADGLKKGHSVEQTRRLMIRKVDRFLGGQETPPEKYGLTPVDLNRLAQRIKSIDALYKLRSRHGLRDR